MASEIRGVDNFDSSEVGTIRKISLISDNTRRVLSLTVGRQTLLTFSYTKTNSDTDLYFNINIPGKGGYNGHGTYWLDIDSSGYVYIGAHTYLPTYGVQESLQCKVPNSAVSVGTHTVTLYSDSNNGKPFDVLNPNGTDHAEVSLGTATHITIMEAAV
jgi:hypothetical protein